VIAQPTQVFFMTAKNAFNDKKKKPHPFAYQTKGRDFRVTTLFRTILTNGTSTVR